MRREALPRAAAMAVDGLMNTRPIEFEVRAPRDCEAMFDLLTYEKGASVLRMLEQHLGADVFREGVRLYLERHRFANAETTDLWKALGDASRLPIPEVMDGWIFRPGYPLVIVEPDGTGIKLSQRRFTYLPSEGADVERVAAHLLEMAGDTAAARNGNEGVATLDTDLGKHALARAAREQAGDAGVIDARDEGQVLGQAVRADQEAEGHMGRTGGRRRVFRMGSPAETLARDERGSGFRWRSCGRRRGRRCR